MRKMNVGLAGLEPATLGLEARHFYLYSLKIKLLQ